MTGFCRHRGGYGIAHLHKKGAPMRRGERALAVGSVVSMLFVGAFALPAAATGAKATPTSARPPSRGGTRHAQLHASGATGPFDVTDLVCTGAPQNYTVPAGTDSVTVRLAGGDGGSAGAGLGGLAGFSSAGLAVTPGETLGVDVGCVGRAPAASATAGGTGGWGYGSGGPGGDATTGGNAGAGGGGASAVLRAGTPLVIVGGGGGSGAGSAGTGLGGDSEQAGANSGTGVTGGGGANASGAGPAGTPGGHDGTGTTGGAGGAATSSTGLGGGGGGGGRFGGGGGGVGDSATDGSGGGGGSALVDAHAADFTGGGSGDGSSSDGDVKFSTMRPPTDASYWNGWDITRGVTGSYDAASNPQPGGYIVDGWGGIHPYGQGGIAAPPAPTGASYWSGWDIVRGIASMPDGSGGFVLDGWGGLHPYGLNGKNPPTVNGLSYWQGWDIARGVSILPDGSGGFVLDGWGALHPFGLGSNNPPAAPKNGPYWAGFDIARGLASPYWNGGTGATGAGGYVLDGWGALHPFGTVAGATVPVPAGTPYWPGWSITRGVVAYPAGGGFVLDGFGGLHPFSAAGLPG